MDTISRQSQVPRGHRVMHWFFIALELVIVGVAIAKTHIPQSSIELSAQAQKQLREMEHRHFIVRAKKESK
jgi:hypothetical protein